VRTPLLCHAAAALLASAASARAADPVPAGGLPDVVGPRTLALGGGVGLATGNEGLFLNPGAIAARTRYSVDTVGYLDRRGAENPTQIFGGSVIDSKTSPIAAGFSYLRVQRAAAGASGDFHGSSWTVAFAGPVADKLFVGASGKFMSLGGVEVVRAATVDAGFFWQVSQLVSIGGAGYNLVPVSHELAAPQGVGAGLTLGSEDVFQITGDWRADLERAEVTKNRYGVGAELLLGKMVPLRAGYQVDEVLDTRWWSVGAGVLARNGVALDLGYRQSLDNAAARTFAASLRVFLDLGQ
jgi:hypothetical protein